MTLQRHTGTHIAVPPLPPVANVPLSPNADKKESEQSQGSHTGEPSQAEPCQVEPCQVEPCQAEGGTQD
jgi:hypothetical protein